MVSTESLSSGTDGLLDMGLDVSGLKIEQKIKRFFRVVFNICVLFACNEATAEVVLGAAREGSPIETSIPRVPAPTACGSGHIVTQDSILLGIVNEILAKETGFTLGDISDVPFSLFVEDCGPFMIINTVLGEYTSGRTRKILLSKDAFPSSLAQNYLLLPP